MQQPIGGQQSVGALYTDDLNPKNPPNQGENVADVQKNRVRRRLTRRRGGGASGGRRRQVPTICDVMMWSDEAAQLTFLFPWSCFINFHFLHSFLHIPPFSSFFLTVSLSRSPYRWEECVRRPRWWWWRGSRRAARERSAVRQTGEVRGVELNTEKEKRSSDVHFGL